MELLKRRPLSTVCTVSILLMLLSSKMDSLFLSVVIPCFCSLCLAVYVFYRNRRGYRKRMRLPKLIIYVSIFLILSLTLSLRAYDFFSLKMGSIEKLVGKECFVKGEITDVGYKEDYAERLYAELCSIDGIESRVKVVIEIDGMSDLEEGDIFTLNTVPTAFTDEEGYLMSDGYVAKLVCDDFESITVVGEAEKGFAFWFKTLNRTLQGIIYRFLDEDAGALVGALVLGNRDELDVSVVRDFRRCGISHVIALSGLHLSIILGCFDFILKQIRITRSIRGFFLAFLGLFYLALTGFSSSCCRAFIMVLAVYLAHILWKGSDAITSLAFASVIILAITPYALVSVSLWMSVIATLGIIVICDIISPLGYKIKKKPVAVQIAYKLLTAVSITLAAIFFVSVFNWLCFGEISIVAPLTNLIISPMITLILVGGLLMIFLSPIFSAAKWIATAVEYVCEVVLGLSAWFSDLRGISVSLEYSFVKYVAIPFVIALVVFLLIRVKHKWTIALIPLATVAMFTICFNVYLSNNKDTTRVTYLKNNSSEVLVINNNSGATLCDVSTGGYRHLYSACEVAEKNGATEIENIVLTHYHNFHAPALFRISNKYKVRNVLLPNPDGYDEAGIYEHIKTALESIGINVITYRRGYAVDVGGSALLTVSRQYFIDRSVHPMFMIRINAHGVNGGDELLYYSSSIFEADHVDYPTSPDYFIIGVHGPKIHKAPDVSLVENAAPRVLLLADGEKMLSSDEIIKALEFVMEKHNTMIVFEKEEYEFILKKAEN